jgi:hypothetical protein
MDNQNNSQQNLSLDSNNIKAERTDLFTSFRKYGGSLEGSRGALEGSEDNLIRNNLIKAIDQQLHNKMYVSSSNPNELANVSIPPKKSSFGALVYAASDLSKDPQMIQRISDLNDKSKYVW